jgi:hypothetical protein
LTSLAQFRTAVSDELGLSNDPSTEQPDIDIWVNKGVTRVLRDTHCYITSATVSGFDGVSSDYSMASSILEIDDMFLTSGGTQYRLERVSVPLLVEQRRVSNPTGTPAATYALAGANLLMFWPTPGASDTLSIYYVPVPTALSSANDDPSTLSLGGIPVSLHEAIEFYACFKGASFDDDQTSSQGQRYHDLYEKEITAYRRLINRRGGQRGARAVVNDTRRKRAFHTNDIYYSGR